MNIFINVLLAFITTIIFPIFISDDTLVFSNSFLSVIFFAGLIILFRYVRNKNYNKRMWIYTHLLGLFFSLMTACGYSLDVYGEVKLKHLSISILLYCHVFAALLIAFWGFLETKEKFLCKPTQNKVIINIESIIDWIMGRPLLLAAMLILCWFPAYIADFPGGFRYDATGELAQATNGYNGNYPMLHSAIITHLLPWTYKYLGSYNVGIALYVFIQMILMAAVYTHILHTFYKQKISSLLLLVITGYCGLFPVIQILVVQEVRDVLFSIMLTYTVFLFYLFETEKERFLNSKVKPILLGVSFALTLLARNNNTGTVMLLLVAIVSILLWVTNYKRNIKGASILAGTAVLSYVALNVLLTVLCQPMTPSSASGSLSIMSQPLVRAWLYEPNSWTKEETDQLQEYMSLDGISYCPENADLTKSRLTVDGKFGDFFLYWCKIGLKHPGCYIDAILANTQNMWFPDTVVDGYKQVFTEPGQPYYEFEKNYYGIYNKLEAPGVHADLWPEVLNFYTKIGLNISFEKVPIISMIFSIGFNFWILLNCAFYALYRKSIKLYLPLAIILGYTIMSAFVPLVLLRYFAALFFLMPMIIAFTVQPSIAALDC